MDYLAKVREYDPKAEEERVARLKRRLSLVLAKRDTASVAASDPKEVERAEAWLKKSCGVTADEAKKAVGDALTTMKDERSKSRLVVYYLAAKNVGKLADL